MTNEIRCPSTTGLISAWENGLGRPGHERALLLLASAFPDTAPDELSRWKVGRRDSVLFRLRRLLFGDSLNSVGRCPRCQAEVELSFTLSDIWPGGVDPPETTGRVAMDGFDVSFRVPDSTDLATARHASSVADARRCLLHRCIVAIAPEAAGDLPGPVEAAVVAAIAACDPAADRRIDVVCPECGAGWEEIFDIAAWLSTEIGAWVRRVIREVHTLASAYGWREEDILAMNPTRRQLYLNILAQASA